MLKTLGAQIGEYKKASVVTPIFMIAEVIMEMIIPLLMASIIDKGVNVGDMKHIYQVGALMLLAALLSLSFGIGGGVFGAKASTGFARNLRKAMYENIQTFSFANIDKFSTSGLVTRLTTDVTNMQNAYQMILRMAMRAPFSLIIAMIMSFYISPRLASIYLAAVIILGCIMAVIVANATKHFTQAFPKYDDLNESVQENVSAIRVVKAYVREDYEKNRFETANGELVGTQLDILLLFSYMTPLMNIILNISIVAIIKVGSVQVAAGGTTPGNVMAAVTYISQILNAVMRATMIFQTVSRGVASGRRIGEVLNCDPVITDGSFSGQAVCKGQVEFQNVSFAYPGMGDRKILDHISFTIHPGETFAILGSTGCGKSSMINLIPRFYDPTEGQVLVDGVNVKDYPLKVLRDKIAVSLQKSEIFSATIGENIRWGKPDALQEQLIKAAETAQAMEFIQTKAEGMDTPVSQGGTSLSGGQKQRLAISRAVLKDAEILIFDDTTSALDLKTEARLYAALQKDYPDTTKIIIAQRIASVKDADRIAVLENGKIAALGTHAQLLESSEIYQDIYNSQAKGVDQNG